MSAARGDANLAEAAKALTTSRYIDAHNLLEEARFEYLKAGVTDRDELIKAIRKRIDDALNVMCSSSDAKPAQPSASQAAPQAGPPGMELSQRLRLAKQEGDDLINQASKALGNREFLKARSLAEKARASFQAAGSSVARERENIVGNLLSYIQVEEERVEANRRRKLKQQKQEEEVKQMAKRVEDALDSSLAFPTDGEQAKTEEPTIESSPKPDLCILVDNGSSRASSTKLLRSIAERLSKRTGVDVTAVSLAHADKTPAEELDGTPARVFSTFLREEVRDRDIKTILVLPLFLGPSKAVTKRIPDILQGVNDEISEIKWFVAPPLCQDNRLVSLMETEVRRTIEENSLDKPHVIVVDHGSPSPEVVAVRDSLADRLRTSMITDDCVSQVHAASMERRPGPEYAFCDPLLIDCIPQVGGGDGDIVLSMAFLLPGTHAGEGGDIDEICEKALMESGSRRRVFKTRLMGESELLLDILHRQYEMGLPKLFPLRNKL